MIPGQTDIDECIALAEGTCDDCPDSATCQAENICLADLGHCPPDDERWDSV